MAWKGGDKPDLVENDQGLYWIVTGGGYSYTCYFKDFPTTTVGLLVTNQQQLTQAYQILECYGITECSEYPNSRKVQIHNIQIEVAVSTNPTVTWTLTNPNPPNVCGQKTVVVSNSSTDGGVDIYLQQ
jgi:hypothetical protein